MAEADLESVIAIEKQSFQTPWSRISFSGELADTYSYNYVVIPISAYPSAQISNLIQVSDFNQQRRAVIAYICFHLITDEAEILKIAVAPEWRRCGTGSWLLDRCLKIIRDKGGLTVFLEVSPSNHAAMKLYHEFGFQVIGKRAGYYPEIKEDALVMMKNFS